MKAAHYYRKGALQPVKIKSFPKLSKCLCGSFLPLKLTHKVCLTLFLNVWICLNIHLNLSDLKCTFDLLMAINPFHFFPSSNIQVLFQVIYFPE